MVGQRGPIILEFDRLVEQINQSIKYFSFKKNILNWSKSTETVFATISDYILIIFRGTRPSVLKNLEKKYAGVEIRTKNLPN